MIAFKVIIARNDNFTKRERKEFFKFCLVQIFLSHVVSSTTFRAAKACLYCYYCQKSEILWYTSTIEGEHHSTLLI